MVTAINHHSTKGHDSANSSSVVKTSQGSVYNGTVGEDNDESNPFQPRSSAIAYDGKQQKYGQERIKESNVKLQPFNEGEVCSNIYFQSGQRETFYYSVSGLERRNQSTTKLVEHKVFEASTELRPFKSPMSTSVNHFYDPSSVEVEGITQRKDEPNPPRESHIYKKTKRIFSRNYSACNPKQHKEWNFYNNNDRIFQRCSSVFNSNTPRESCNHKKTDRTFLCSFVSSLKPSVESNAFLTSCLEFKNKRLLIILTVMLLAPLGDAYCPVSLGTMEEVEDCPTNKQEWEKKAFEKNCSKYKQNCTDSSHFVYHCLPSMNLQVNVEVCAPMIYSSEYCCEFNSLGAVIQRNYDANCRNYSTPCTHSFPSTESYKYPECYISDSQYTLDENGGSNRSKLSEGNIDVNIIVGVLVGIILLAVLVLYRFGFLRKLKEKIWQISGMIPVSQRDDRD